MQVWCVGAGSVGLLLASKLALAGADVTVIARSEEQAEQIRTNGILLRQQEGAVLDIRVQTSVIREMNPDQTPNWILLTVKQQHITEGLVAEMGRRCRAGARLLCFQNGIGHIERLHPDVPASRLDWAVTTEGARKEGPATISHTGRGLTRIGSALPEIPANEAEIAEKEQKKLAELLNAAGFVTFVSNNMREIAWNKLLMNAVINPLTAILECRNGELLNSEALAPLMRTLYEEGADAAAAAGIRLHEDLWNQLLDVCRKTANNHSSMLQDLLAGRTTEIDWLNGALLAEARARQLALPTHEAVYRLVKAKEKR
ncbi:ketopantoate reductase family protein [Paenibacillus koleovorans]|uniref:ketopantoate reductase family protein n=1 Tax=Paenibacillus koleovorans TaxID=121608 RepID=UPI000FDC0C60|nr:2-dehydropantoate 2-reductase [Paenibacillus koleovorans]